MKSVRKKLVAGADIANLQIDSLLESYLRWHELTVPVNDQLENTCDDIKAELHSKTKWTDEKNGNK